MPQPTDITDLIRRFVDDRDGLEEHEYAQLVEAVKESPELATQLRDQLLIDDTLSQRLAIDRRHFDAQVQQRIADHLRGEDELNQQADELRSLALARLEGVPAEPATSWSTVVAWGSALVLLLAIGVSLWSWRQSQQAALVATVAQVSGEVIIQRYPNASDVRAAVGQSLQVGDVLHLPDEASMALTWSDGTRVQLGGGTQISLPKTTAGKWLSISLGDVAASVAPQPAGRPMVFVTPQADAIVRGTELYLHVQASNTRLEVAEGTVELVERQMQDVQLVGSSQSATAILGERITRTSIRWPTSQQGLVYLFAGGQRPTLVRSRSLLQRSRLEPQGDGAAFNSQGELALSGGWSEDTIAAADVAARIQSANAMSLEVAIAPSQPADDQPRAILQFVTDDRVVCSLAQAGHRLQFVAGDNAAIDIGSLAGVGKLSHLAIICANHEMMAYLDGQLLVQSRFRGALPGNASRLIVGGVDPDARWHGRIAGLAIYDRKLDPAEIERNFAGLINE